METGLQSQVESYKNLKKIILYATLLSTQHFKVQVKGKVEQTKGKESSPPRYLGEVANGKRALGSPSTRLPTLLFLLYIYIYIYIYMILNIHWSDLPPNIEFLKKAKFLSIEVMILKPQIH